MKIFYSGVDCNGYGEPVYRLMKNCNLMMSFHKLQGGGDHSILWNDLRKKRMGLDIKRPIRSRDCGKKEKDGQ